MCTARGFTVEIISGFVQSFPFHSESHLHMEISNAEVHVVTQCGDAAFIRREGTCQIFPVRGSAVHILLTMKTNKYGFYLE